MKSYSLATTFLLVLALLLAITPLARAGQDDGILALVIANADELVAAGPDSRLAIDVFNSLKDRELWRLNVHEETGPRAQELVQLLISLASPDEIKQTSSHSIDTRDNQGKRIKGTAIAVAPVADLDRFIEAIDYGQVIAKDESKWILLVRIDPEEITVDQIMARVEKTGRRPPGLFRLKGEDFPPLSDGFDRSDFEPPSRRNREGLESSRSKPSDRLDTQGVSFGKDDQVKVTIADEMYEAVIESVKEDDDDNIFRVKLADVQALAQAINKRALRTRLKRAKEFSLLVPEDRLRMVKSADPSSSQGGAASASTNGDSHSARIWNDKSGKFQVIATYGGFQGQKVRLVKPSGKESLVPLSRLCSADQAYVAKALEVPNGATAPVATSSSSPSDQPTPPRELRANWDSVRTVRSRRFRRWDFVPPTDKASASTIQPAESSLDFSRPPSPGPFGEELLKLVISQDGSTAFGLIEAGKVNSERLYLQELDFAHGKSGKLFVLPEESVVLDILPEERLILLRTDKFNNNKNNRLYLQRIGQQGLEPVTSWITSHKDNFFKDIESAWFLADGRVMTELEHADSYVIWDRKTAQALYTIPIQRGSFEMAMDPGRRVLAMTTKEGVSLINTSTGNHVATVTHKLEGIKAIAVSDDLHRVVIAGRDNVAAWDLTNGESLFKIPLPANVTANSLAWMGDRPLVNERYLLDPELSVLLWEYTIVSGVRGSLTQVRGGRLWYAPVRDKGMALYAASIVVPHAAVLETISRMGDPESLLVASPGSKMHITLETDRGDKVEQELAENVAKNLTAAGYQCVDHPEGEALTCHVVCQSAGKQEIRINMSRRPFPDKKDIITRQIEPYFSHIAISQGETEIWKVGWRAGPGGAIFINRGESLDDALKRLTTPNVKSLLHQQFPSHLTRPGNATPAGAYGSSELAFDGVVQDNFGDE